MFFRSFTVLLLLTVSTACVPKSQYLKVKDDRRLTRAQLEEEQKKLITTQMELDEAQKRIAFLEGNLEQMRAARDQAIQGLEAELARAKASGSARASELETELNLAKQERETQGKLQESQVALLKAELAKAQEEARLRAEEIARLNQTYQDLMRGLEEEIDQGRVTITNLKGKLTVNLTDKILFDSGSAELNADGKRVLDKVSSVLKDVRDRRISVEGHTDDVPISKAGQEKFPSNWELSAARASTVVRYLMEKGVQGDKLNAAGYAMFAPLVPNDSEEHRRQNRRIEIVLLPRLTAEPVQIAK